MCKAYIISFLSQCSIFSTGFGSSKTFELESGSSSKAVEFKIESAKTKIKISEQLLNVLAKNLKLVIHLQRRGNIKIIYV